jgi:hypothetical protein
MAGEDGYPFDLGPFHWEITTSSAAAQRWFNRGIIWCFGFGHAEAARCFERALTADPACAMAHWGIAYAGGPNYNYPWSAYGGRGRVACVATAHRHLAAAAEAVTAGAATPLEAALVRALQAVYPEPTPTLGPEEWMDGTAVALRRVYDAFPDDANAAFLFAEALMNVTPWRLWDTAAAVPAPGAHTLEAAAVLERAIGAAEAAGVCHPGTSGSVPPPSPLSLSLQHALLGGPAGLARCVRACVCVCARARPPPLHRPGTQVYCTCTSTSWR